MSKIKYRPQYSLAEVQSISQAIKYAVENGSTDTNLPAIYNKMELFLYKCNMGINAPQKVLKTGTQEVAPATQVARSASHSSPDSESFIDSQNTKENNKDTEDTEDMRETISSNESKTLAQGDAATFEELSYNKLKMFHGDESKLNEEELLAAAAHKVNKRMDVTQDEMDRAQKYLMNSIMGV